MGITRSYSDFMKDAKPPSLRMFMPPDWWMGEDKIPQTPTFGTAIYDWNWYSCFCSKGKHVFRIMHTGNLSEYDYLAAIAYIVKDRMEEFMACVAATPSGWDSNLDRLKERVACFIEKDKR